MKPKISSRLCEALHFSCRCRSCSEGGTVTWVKTERRAAMQQWKFWSLIGHLIHRCYQRRTGDSDYLRDYLVPVCSSLSPCLTFAALPGPLLLPPPDILPGAHKHAEPIVQLGLIPEKEVGGLLHAQQSLRKYLSAPDSWQRNHQEFGADPDAQIKRSNRSRAASDTFAGIPFIALSGDHLDRNLQANSEQTFLPRSSETDTRSGPTKTRSPVSFSIQMLQSKRQTVGSLFRRGCSLAPQSDGT